MVPAVKEDRTAAGHFPARQLISPKEQRTSLSTRISSEGLEIRVVVCTMLFLLASLIAQATDLKGPRLLCNISLPVSDLMYHYLMYHNPI